MIPFSNGTEYMYWTAENCDTCVRAFRPANGKEMPDFEITQKLVNLGRECRIKFAIEYSAGVGTGEVPDEVAALAGWKEGAGWPWQCMMHSDDDDDRWKPTTKPRDPAGPNQLMLFSIIDEAMEETRNIEKQELIPV